MNSDSYLQVNGGGLPHLNTGLREANSIILRAKGTTGNLEVNGEKILDLDPLMHDRFRDGQPGYRMEKR